MPRNGGNWLRLLRKHLGAGDGNVDLPAALEHLDPAVRVLAAGVVWARTGGRQTTEMLPIIAASIGSGERWAQVFGCQLLAEIGPASVDLVPLVRELLDHPESGVRLNAAFALLKCCSDRGVLATARERLASDPDAAAVYVAHKLGVAINANPVTSPGTETKGF